MTSLDLSASLGPLFAELRAGLEANTSATKALARAQRTAMLATPWDARIVAQSPVAVNAAGFAVLQLFPGPDQGVTWYLRNLVVGRADAAVSTPVAGQAWLISSAGMPPPTAQLSTIGVRDSWNPTGPPVQPQRFYTSHQVTCKAPDDLFVVITGGTNGQLVTAEAWVEVVPDVAAPQSYDI